MIPYIYAAAAGIALATALLLLEPPVATQEPISAAIVASTSYRYDAPPSISREAYGAIVCAAGPACDEAGAMYDVLVEAGIDPVVEAAQAQHETGLGTDGIGRSAYKNLHGVQCHASDGRIADSKVDWGNGCAGVYASYSDSVRTWANVINREYIALGLNTPALAVSKYAPVSDGNDPPAYVADMERHIDQWREQYGMEETRPVDGTRAQLVSYALSLQGIPYVRGGRSASGGDCSGTMQHVYLQVTGIDIGGTTFSQYPGLQPVDETQLQPGDLWFGQYSDDQHVGMVADVDGDGRWDLINNGGLASSLHVDMDFMSQGYFADHTMGYRRAL